VPAGRAEEPVDSGVVERLAGRREALAQERRELRRRDRPDLEPLGAAPERLVLVVEDPLEDVALAAQVDVPDLGLRLEHRAHQVRELAVERDDLLELVQHEDDAPLSLGGELGRELEQPLDRVVDVLLAAAGGEAEAKRSVGRVDLHRRNDPEATEEARGLLERLVDGRGDVRVDRLRERGREPLLRRRAHEVAVADEHLLPQRLLGRAQDERRLAVAPRRVQEDVLAVAHVGRELAHLVLPVGERLVEGEIAERERVQGLMHDYIMHIAI
jgi:hypothetical protein